jgi:hypothetical protein
VSGNDQQSLIYFATYSARAEATEDDSLFARALERRGARVRAAAWDDPAAAWSSAAAVIVRSTWDYHLRVREFLDWVDRVASATRMHNDARIIHWNAHKKYLGELSRRGVRVIDTVFADAGAGLDLASLDIVGEAEEVVVKPAVSASAHETRRFASHERGAAQAHLDRLLEHRDVMIQPHVAALAERGELSLMYARGVFSHAVRRRSALVDAGAMPKSAATSATSTARRFAEDVLGTAADAVGVPPNDLLYARVDLAETSADEYLLLELELIEPSLFFAHAPEAADRFADAILSA